MFSMILFFLFIFSFWLIHIISRIFKHAYIWQIKEYRCDRIKVYLKEAKAFSLRNQKTIIPLILLLFDLILLRFLQSRIFYLVILIGFGYYVYSALVVLPQIFSRRIVRPKKSIRNAMIVIGSILISLLPILLVLILYIGCNSQRQEAAVGKENGSTSIVQIFPERDSQTNVLLIPLETISTVIMFGYMFLFDLAIPVIVAFMVSLTSIASRLTRKKK